MVDGTRNLADSFHCDKSDKLSRRRAKDEDDSRIYLSGERIDSNA